jgi:hypothetical protein
MPYGRDMDMVMVMVFNATSNKIQLNGGDKCFIVRGNRITRMKTTT